MCEVHVRACFSRCLGRGSVSDLLGCQRVADFSLGGVIVGRLVDVCSVQPIGSKVAVVVQALEQRPTVLALLL